MRGRKMSRNYIKFYMTTNTVEHIRAFLNSHLINYDIGLLFDFNTHRMGVQSGSPYGKQIPHMITRDSAGMMHSIGTSEFQHEGYSYPVFLTVKISYPDLPGIIPQHEVELFSNIDLEELIPLREIITDDSVIVFGRN